MKAKYLYLLSAGHLSVDINSGSLPALLPFFVAEYGMDYTAVAGLTFASSFLSSIVQPVTGYLADRAQRQWFMVLGILMAGLSLAATGFLMDYWAIFAAVTLMGIGSAIFHPEAAHMANRLSGAAKGRGMSIFSVGGNAGFGLGPLLAVFLVSAFGMKSLAFYGVASVILASFILFNIPALKAESARQEARAERLERVTGEGATNDWNGFSRLTLLILFRSTVQAGLGSFLPLFCIGALGASIPVAGATLSIISLGGVIATLIGGRLADRWGYVKTLRRGCLLMVPALAVVAFSGQLWAVYAMLIPIALAQQGPYSSFVVLGQSYLAKNIGLASGVTLGLSFSLGGVMVPSLGAFADKFGIELIMPLLVGIAALAALASLLLPQPKKA